MARITRSTFPQWMTGTFFLLILAYQAMAEPDAATREKILAGFYPYRQGPPQVEGITPGMTITKNNAQVAAAVLPPEVLAVVQNGDLDITVQATTDLPIREEYIHATLTHGGQVSLGADGMLQNYVAGLPFPLIDATDAQAGSKRGGTCGIGNVRTSHTVGELLRCLVIVGRSSARVVPSTCACTACIGPVLNGISASGQREAFSIKTTL